MLTIRPSQMKVFAQSALRRFEDEMVVHIEDFSPRLCRVIGEEQVRLAVRKAIARSGDYGFTNRGPIRLFVELVFLFGSAFDTDPQYLWAAKILNESDYQMLRAARLRDKTLDYQEKVPVLDLANTRTMLTNLSEWAAKHATSSATEFVASMLRELARICPQKAAYVGREGLTELVLEGCAEATKYQVSTVRREALLGVLMFAFGHGFIGDPLYPWALRTLNDKKITDPPGRAEGLEKEAMSVVEQLIGIPWEGERT